MFDWEVIEGESPKYGLRFYDDEMNFMVVLEREDWEALDTVTEDVLTDLRGNDA